MKSIAFGSLSDAGVEGCLTGATTNKFTDAVETVAPFRPLIASTFS